MPFFVCRYQYLVLQLILLPPHRLPCRVGELHIPISSSNLTHTLQQHAQRLQQPHRILQVHLLKATLRTARNSENATAKQNSANTTCVAMRWAERAGLSSSLESTLLEASRKLKRRGTCGIGSGIRGFGSESLDFERSGDFGTARSSWGGSGKRERSPW